MKAAIFAPFVLGIVGVCAMPSPDLVTVTDEVGHTFVGADKASLAVRGLEARCDCGLFCQSPHADCDPGACECAGNFGCWACGGRMQCQPGPGSGVWWA
ncbi:hypothetical protein TOPH_06411 [Tolypocladium ophioglossoides CBS 100239]|uniref:Uncharacterized protein n=1 Tax=Tolypocladium ophioglossoides (strain CBS 100239) TaxID=1163406 RepID=A0A0L0N4C0_TOLOC|nr:hypothetical protein TOPH_06411 [Tolypocladium ophioglossoides CBS 100239]